MRYQFVDCRWELGSPGAGRERYLAGHIPGASFLDVDEELSAPPGPAAGTRCRAPTTSPRQPRGPGSARASSWSPTGTWAGPSGSGGCCATSATTTARCSSSRAGSGRCAPARSRSSRPIRPARAHRRHDPARRAGAAAGRARGRRRPPAGALARRAEPGRPQPRPDPRRPERALERAAARVAGGELVAYCGSGITACVVLHRLALEGREGRLYPGSWSQWEQLDLPLERA